MEKQYNYDESNEIIGEAWDLAIEHLKSKLGKQYKCSVTKDAIPDFFDCVQQDIDYKKLCPKCNTYDDEGNFTTHKNYESAKVEICYTCCCKLDEENMNGDW